MSARRRLERLEQDMPSHDWAAIRANLDAMPYTEPTRAELLALKRELAIPSDVFRNLFGEQLRAAK